MDRAASATASPHRSNAELVQSALVDAFGNDAAPHRREHAVSDGDTAQLLEEAVGAALKTCVHCVQ